MHSSSTFLLPSPPNPFKPTIPTSTSLPFPLSLTSLSQTTQTPKPYPAINKPTPQPSHSLIKHPNTKHKPLVFYYNTPFPVALLGLIVIACSHCVLERS